MGFELSERFLRRVIGWKSVPVCLGTMLGSRFRLCIINISLLYNINPIESKITRLKLHLYHVTFWR